MKLSALQSGANGTFEFPGIIRSPGRSRNHLILKIRRSDMRTTHRIPTVPSGGIAHQFARLPVKGTSLLKTILLVAGLAGTDPDPNIRLQLHRESLRGRW